MQESIDLRAAFNNSDSLELIRCRQSLGGIEHFLSLPCATIVTICPLKSSRGFRHWRHHSLDRTPPRLLLSLDVLVIDRKPSDLCLGLLDLCEDFGLLFLEVHDLLLEISSHLVRHQKHAHLHTRQNLDRRAPLAEVGHRKGEGRYGSGGDDELYDYGAGETGHRMLDHHQRHDAYYVHADKGIPADEGAVGAAEDRVPVPGDHEDRAEDGRVKVVEKRLLVERHVLQVRGCQLQQDALARGGYYPHNDEDVAHRGVGGVEDAGPKDEEGESERYHDRPLHNADVLAGPQHQQHRRERNVEVL
mmetsp:Transcript_679/g.1189  ORF Transcript_679/g.1189 Transcript_679/m.1189 type:complete len:303 (+) Transcript_679:98-1006(+)